MLPKTPAGWENLTGIFVGLWFTSAIAYTAFARVFGGNEATISACTQKWSMDWPIIPLIVGLIGGHVFFPVWGFRR